MEHVQCENWLEVEIPEETSILLELVELVENLLIETLGTLLVHCSGGAGRTGTFIALYKLIQDIDNMVRFEYLLFCFLRGKICKLVEEVQKGRIITHNLK